MKRTRTERRRHMKQKSHGKSKKRQQGGQPNNNRRGLAAAMARSLMNAATQQPRCMDPEYCPEGGKHGFEQVEPREWMCMKCGCTLPYKPSMRNRPNYSAERGNSLENERRKAKEKEEERKRKKEEKEKEEKEKKEKEEKEKEEKEKEKEREYRRKLKEEKNECTIM